MTGLGFDRAGWIPVLPELEREFRIVLIDNRGTGQSTTNPDVDRPRRSCVCLGLRRVRGSGFLGGFAGRRVPEEVLADPLFADVEDRADLVEGAAEFSELVGGRVCG